MALAKRYQEARKALKKVWEERKRAEHLPPPKTLEEELRRQDEIARRAAIERKYLPILEEYRAKMREQWRRRKREERKAKKAKAGGA